MAPVRGLDPWAIQKSADGSIGISAEDARSSLGALWAQSAPERTYSGVVPQGADPTTKTPAGLIVSPTSPATMNLTVGPGQFVVQSDIAGTPYSGAFHGTSTVTVQPSDSVNDRIDVVYVWVEDSDVSLGEGKGSFLDVLPGTPGSGEAPTLPDGSVSLAVVQVPAGATAVGAVLDARAFAVAAGGIRPVYNGIGLDDPGYPGQSRNVVNNDGTFSVEFFSGKDGLWLPIASEVRSWTPVIYSDTKSNIDVGNGGLVNAYYQVFVGGLIFVRVLITIGNSGYSLGSGPIRVSYPPGLTPTVHQRLVATIDGVNNTTFSGVAYLGPEQGAFMPVFPYENSGLEIHYLRTDQVKAGTTINFSGVFAS